MNSLKKMQIWLIWRQTDEEVKIPCHPDSGRYGLRWTDHNNLVTYREAYEASLRHNAGIGLVLPPHHYCIDLDSVVTDGEIDPRALELIGHCDSWTEISPSGRGIHI